MAAELGVPDALVNAVPTDGLWGDNRTDEDQIGATYAELEWALDRYDRSGSDKTGLSVRQIEIMRIYEERHVKNKHKLELPPVCIL